MLRKLPKQKLFKLLSYWPPFLGAGIKVTHVSDSFDTIEVEMKLSRLNKNYVGTHFGGSLYSMCDPFYMLMLIQLLGPKYIVWDKAAAIRFKKPGRGTVKARFHIPLNKVDEIRKAADSNPKVEPEFLVHVIDHEGTIIAEVTKLLYVKKSDSRERR